MNGLAEVRPIVPERRVDDVSKSRLTVRDVILLLAGSLAMYGAQIGVQWGMRSDIRDLRTAFDGYVRQQTSTNEILQRQIDEWRSETRLNRVNIENNDKALAELRGMLVGAGVKGVQK